MSVSVHAFNQFSGRLHHKNGYKTPKAFSDPLWNSQISCGAANCDTRQMVAKKTFDTLLDFGVSKNVTLLDLWCMWLFILAIIWNGASVFEGNNWAQMPTVALNWSINNTKDANWKYRQRKRDSLYLGFHNCSKRSKMFLWAVD